MTAKQAIELLSQYEPEEQLIIGWWDKDFFDTYDTDITDEEWKTVIKHAVNLDWSAISDEIENVVMVYHIESEE